MSRPLLLMILGASRIASAQELPAAEPTRETVRVEAERLDEQVQLGIFGSRLQRELPVTVRSFGARQIEDEQLVTANQLLRHDPGLSNASTPGGFSAFNLSFRGMPSGADAISFDGLGPGAMFSGSLGQLYSVERVEVYRGPSSAFGSFSPTSSVGGAVNIVPKQAQPQSLYRAALGYRERGIVSGHLDLNQRVSADTQVRVNLASEGGETFYRGREERDVATIHIRHRLSDRVSLGAGLEQFRIRADGYQNGFILAADVPVPKAPTGALNHFQKWAFLEQEWQHGYANLLWQIRETWQFKVQGLYGIRRRPLLSSGTGVIQNEDGSMLLRPNSFGQNTRYKPFFGGNAELRGSIDQGPVRHRLQLSYLGHGFDFISAPASPLAPLRSNLYRPVYFDAPELNTPAIGLSSKVRSQTLAFSDELNINDWRLLLGAKNSTLTSSTYDIPSGVSTLEQHDSATLPFASLALLLAPRQQIYISYAQGLERGGVAPATASNAGAILDPMTSEQFELGWKSEIEGGITFDLALFEMQRAFEYTDSISLRYAQDGEQRNRGLELMSEGLAGPMRWQAGAMWLEPRLLKSSSPGRKEAPGVPRLTLPASLSLSLPAGMESLVAVQHFSPQYVDQANTRRLDAWTRVDAGLKFTYNAESGPWIASLLVENVGDQRYWASAAGGQLSLVTPQIWKFGLRTEI